MNIPKNQAITIGFASIYLILSLIMYLTNSLAIATIVLILKIALVSALGYYTLKPEPKPKRKPRKKKQPKESKESSTAFSTLFSENNQNGGVPK